MRNYRLRLIFLAFYFTFIGGGTYYTFFFPIRVFHHAFVTILGSLWLIQQVRKRGLPKTQLNTPIFALVVVWFISAFAGIDPRLSIEHLWFMLLHILLFFYIVDLFQRGYSRLVMETLFFMAAVIIMLSGIELASWYFGLGILPGTEIGWVDVGRYIPPSIPRISLAMGGVSTLLAGYVAPLVTVVMVWSMTTPRKDYKRALRWIAFILLAILILTYSRGGLISLFASIGAFSLLRLIQSPKIKNKFPPKLVLILGGFCIVLGLIAFALLTLSVGRGQSNEGRLDMWRSAVEITNDNPVIGSGNGTFGRVFREYRTPELARDKLATAHNLYLNTLSEIGVIGFLATVALGIAFAYQTFQTWKLSGRSTQIRIEGTVSALVGVAMHSVVDVFTVTPIVLMILILAGFSLIGHRSRLDPVPDGQKIPAIIGIVILIGYGVFWIQVDRAQNLYWNNLSNREQIQQAQTIDTYLNLYHLHEAYLLGRNAESPEEIQEAKNVYEEALALEPTWDIGWLNLAALSERQDDLEEALEYVTKARQIKPIGLASFQWARLAETTDSAKEQAIIEAYVDGFGIFSSSSDFWWETPLRQTALLHAIAIRPVDVQYRILLEHDETMAHALVKENPQNAPEWWVLGEYTLTVENKPELAVQYFTNAIELDDSDGDYYVSRVRANLTLNPDASLRDIDLARLLGTQFEYPELILAEFAESPEEKRDLEQQATRQRSVPQEFAGVLYLRPAVFDVYPEMQNLPSE